MCRRSRYESSLTKALRYSSSTTAYRLIARELVKCLFQKKHFAFGISIGNSGVRVVVWRAANADGQDRNPRRLALNSRNIHAR